MWKSRPEDVAPEPVDMNNDLTPEEIHVFTKSAGQINFLMGKVFDAAEDSPEVFGSVLGVFAMFMFKLGRDHANEGNS